MGVPGIPIFFISGFLSPGYGAFSTRGRHPGQGPRDPAVPTTTRDSGTKLWGTVPGTENFPLVSYTHIRLTATQGKFSANKQKLII